MLYEVITKPVLLHGVTGSGKTELYLRLVKATIEQSKTAIVLVPEISLTPQTVKRFQARFPGIVGIIHSQISRITSYNVCYTKLLRRKFGCMF